MPLSRSLVGAIMFGAVVSLSSFFASSAFAETTACPLPTLKPYKTPRSASIYFISEDCKKRPIRNPQVYFSHFSSWKDVQITNEVTLNQIPDHELSFLPWGPRRVFENGSLIKTVTDPNVYLVQNNTDLYRIASENVLTDTLGFAFNQIEDVDERVMKAFMIKSEITADQKGIPSGFVFKYPDDPSVYTIEPGYKEGKLVVGLKHLYTMNEIANKEYRTDRIATIKRTANTEKVPVFNRGVASQPVFKNTCSTAFTYTPQAYLEVWKNVFKEENGLSDQEFATYISVESVSMREEGENECSLTIGYNVHYSSHTFPQVDMFTLATDNLTAPNQLPRKKDRTDFTGVSSISLKQSPTLSNKKQLADFYLKKYNLVNATAQVQSIDVKSSTGGQSNTEVPGQKGEIVARVFGVKNSEENKCFSGYISLSSKETTYEEVRCKR